MSALGKPTAKQVIYSTQKTKHQEKPMVQEEDVKVITPTPMLPQLAPLLVSNAAFSKTPLPYSSSLR